MAPLKLIVGVTPAVTIGRTASGGHHEAQLVQVEDGLWVNTLI
jgi:hypothetical protein